MSSYPQTLTVTEERQLLDALLQKNVPHKSFRKDIRNYLFGCLMLDAGLRVGEVAALEMSHLYFKDEPVNTLVLTADITKNHKERTVPVCERLKNALHEYLKENSWLLNEKRNYYVFSIAFSSRSITTRQIERIINTAGMKALNRPVHPHMLRHTFASKLMRITDIRTVQDLLGHKHVSSTQIYTHPNEDDKKKAIEEMGSGRFLNVPCITCRNDGVSCNREKFYSDGMLGFVCKSHNPI